MATPPSAVAFFMNITGAPESVAVQKIKEHGGDINEAINVYFYEVGTHEYGNELPGQEQNLVAASQYSNPGASNQNPLAQSSASYVLDDEMDEEMVQAMIEDSKMDTGGGSSWMQMDVLKDSSDGGLPQSHSQQEDNDFDCALSMCLEESRKKDQVITIVVRMPDGRRLEKNFHKTDTLQELFDFVDKILGFKEYKSLSYRLVKRYPCRAYTIRDCGSIFDEVGLSSYEVLHLEWI